MRRPLFFGCICLIMLIAVWTSCFDAPPFYGTVPVEEGAFVTITGQLHQKETRSYYGAEQIHLYLKSIKIIHSDTGQVFELNPQSKIICELNKTGKEPQLGSILRISGIWKTYEHASNPGEFDLANYYAIEGICGKLTKSSVENCSKAYWPLREKLYVLRNLLKTRLYQALPDTEASILAKMLLGEKSGLDEEVKELYQRNGIVHILSISGLHITMIGMGIYKLLRKCSCPPVPAAVAGALLLLLYGMMTGFGVSSCRAIGMYLIRMLGEACGRSYDMLTSVGIMMACMLLDNPRLLYHCGFLFSFGSVCAIGCLYPILPLQETVQKKRAVPLPFLVRFLLKRCNGLLQGLWASASVSIFTLPIMLYFFYRIPVYAPFVNLLVLPFMGTVMTVGFGLMLFPQCSLLSQLECIILGGYERVCLLFEKLPGHNWTTGRPELWKVGVYYLAILFIIWLCSGEKDENQKRGSAVNKFKYIRSKWWMCAIILPVLFLGIHLKREDSIAFLAVGQGDCMVVMSQTGKTYLFDGGSSSERSVGEDIIQPFLAYHGISKIDGVFLSHPDEDHMNGVMELLEKELVEIESIYLPDVAEECKADCQEILEMVRGKVKERPRIVYYSAGDYLKEGELFITCLHPEKGFAGETNTYSGCFLVESPGWRVLLTGDVENIGEELLTEQLLERKNEKVQVLKVAHHGSKYSTGEEFLDVISAQLAIISCGEGNSYGHPHQETLEKLDKKRIPYCITWQSGCIIVTKEGYRFFKR